MNRKGSWVPAIITASVAGTAVAWGTFWMLYNFTLMGERNLIGIPMFAYGITICWVLKKAEERKNRRRRRR